MAFSFKRFKTVNDFIENKIDTAEIALMYSARASYKLLAIHIAASYIANALSKCEFKLYQDKKKVKDLNYYRLNIEPNKNYNGSRLWNKVAMKMLTNPDGALIVRVGDKFYVADEFQLEHFALNGDMFHGVVIDGYQLYKSFKHEDVFYFKLEDENVTAFIDGMYEDYGKSISYAAESFNKANSDKYKLKVEAQKIGDKTFQEYYNETIKDMIKPFLEKGGVFPEMKGYTLEEFKNRPQTKDSTDLINLRKDVFQIAGQAFKIPLSMMEGNINNMEAVVEAFLTFSVEPVAKLMEDELTRKIYGYDGYVNDCYCKIDTSKIPFTSIIKNADKAGTLIANTICNPDEVRDLFGLDYIDEEYMKQYYVTKNNSKAEDVMNGTAEDGKE